MTMGVGPGSREGAAGGVGAAVPAPDGEATAVVEDDAVDGGADGPPPGAWAAEQADERISARTHVVARRQRTARRLTESMSHTLSRGWSDDRLASV